MVTTRAAATSDQRQTRSSSKPPSSPNSKPSPSRPRKSNGSTHSSPPRRKAPEVSAHAGSPGKSVLVKKRENEQADGEGDESAGKEERSAKRVKFDKEAEEGGEVVGEAAEGKMDVDEKEAEDGKEEEVKLNEKAEVDEKDGDPNGEAEAEQTSKDDKAPANGEEEKTETKENGQQVEEGPKEGEAPLKPRSGILERGALFFFYRPKVEQTSVSSLSDISRSSLVLVPRSPSAAPGPITNTKHHYRTIVIGKKKLPEDKGTGGRRGKDVLWATVQKVGEDLDEVKKEMGPTDYETKTMGHRHIEPSRLAARGCYLLFHNTSGPPSSHTTYLYYSLTHPSSFDSTSPAAELGFSTTGSGTLIIQSKNPTASSGPNQGLPPDERADYSDKLIDDVYGGEADGGGGRRYNAVDRPGLLDYEGAEVLLIGSSKEGENGDRTEEEAEAEKVGEANMKDLEETAKEEGKMEDEEVMKELKLDTETYGNAFDGEWF